MKADLLLPLGSGLVFILALGVSIVSLYINRRQKRIDNLIAVQQFLHNADLSGARRAIREGDTPPTLKDEKVRRVCSSFDFAAVLVRHGAVDKEIFLDYWRIPLLALDKPLSSLSDQSTGDCTIKDYYKDFW